MQDRIYLLSIGDFLEESGGEERMKVALGKVDVNRRKKAERMKRLTAKAACIGAGLLLQYAVRVVLQGEAELKDEVGEAVAERLSESIGLHDGLTELTVPQLISQIETAMPLEFSYGVSGKPYFKEYPFYFNLSHSGDYVVCAISEKEIGIDIQEHRSGNMERIAKRYFSSREIQTLEKCSSHERTQLFFDMWAKKEAYGKYTGGGIAESLEMEIPASQVVLQFIHSIPGYSLAICKAI